MCHQCQLSSCFVLYVLQSSEDLDTDTEFEPVEDMTLETRSRCMAFYVVFFLILNIFILNILIVLLFLFCFVIMFSHSNYKVFFFFSLFKTASAHTGEGTVDEYPDISGITTARVS